MAPLSAAENPMVAADVTLAFDTPPLAADLSLISDYTSINLYPAVSAQLFRWNGVSHQLVPAACAAYAVADDLQRYELKLTPGLRWEDGSVVRARQYVDRFADIFSCNAPVVMRFDNIRDIAVGSKEEAGESLVFRLSRPDAQFLNKLAHPALGPLGGARGATDFPSAAGPFRCVSVREDGGTLERVYSPRLRTNVRKLNFVYIEDPNEAVDRYEEGRVDATCPASFPLDRLSEFAGRRDFIRGPDTTFYILIPVSDQARDKVLRRALAACIDPLEIIGLFPGALTLMDGFVGATDESCNPPASGDCFHDTCATDRTTPEQVRGAQLRIAFDDFPPNRDIATTIATQVHAYGGEVELIVDNYAAQNASCDFKLAVVVNSLSYPLDVYRRIAKASVFQDDPLASLQYWEAIRAYDEAQEESVRAGALAKLHKIIRQELPIIPIVQLRQFGLKRRSLDGFSWESDRSWLCM